MRHCTYEKWEISWGLSRERRPWQGFPLNGARSSHHVFVVYKVLSKLQTAEGLHVCTLKNFCIVNGPTDPYHYERFIKCGAFFTITLYRLSLVVTVALML